MSGVMNTLRRGTKTLGTWFGVGKDSKLYDKVGFMTSGKDEAKARAKNRRRRMSKVDAAVDEDKLGTARRRTAMARGGGRLSTILSESDRLGG